MVIIASLATGCLAALLVAAIIGHLPTHLRRRLPRAGMSTRGTWLLQAGVGIQPGRFLALSAALGLAAFVLLTLATRAPAVALVPALVVGLVPRAYLARRRAARLREIQEAWPEGLRELTAAISAGLSLNQALASLATNGPGPLRGALARYPLLANVLGVVPALEVMKEELADPTSDRVIEVLILAHQRGGHLLGDVLGDLAEATTRDVRTRQEIATEALEQKINARAVFVLPWLVLLVLVVQPGHFQDFYRTGGGAVVVGVGAIMSLLGGWAVGRLSRDPDEARVFGAAATRTGNGVEATRHAGGVTR